MSCAPAVEAGHELVEVGLKVPARPYVRASSMMSAVNRSSSSRPRGILRCVEVGAFSGFTDIGGRTRRVQVMQQRMRATPIGHARRTTGAARGSEVFPGSLLKDQLVQHNGGGSVVGVC